MGQPHVVRALQTALSTGRTAQAFLFTGPRGTGKTSAARLLAKALCCENGPAAEPCNACSICVSITDGTCLDVTEMDAASEATVDDVREAIVRVADYVPSVCRYRVFIVDEVHDLSPKAFDALLKTVEEPPPHLVFVLATTEYTKVPPTIRSRCQKYEFHRASVSDLVSRLHHVAGQEGIQVEPAALSAMARMADGAFRDALNLLEQAWLTADGPITLTHAYSQLGLIEEDTVDELLMAMSRQETGKIVEVLAGITRLGGDPRAVLESILYRLSDLTRAAFAVDEDGSSDASRSASMREAASRLGTDSLIRLRGHVAEAHRAVKDVTLPRIWLESELIRLSMGLGESKAVTRAQTPSANPKPTPVSEPRGEPNVAPDAEPDPLPEAAESSATPNDAGSNGSPAATDSPADDQSLPQRVWSQVVRTIQEHHSKAVGHKLVGSKALSADNGVLVVEFDRQMDRDGVLEGPNGPQRAAFLLKLAREISGEPWEIEYRVAKRPTSRSQAAAAVELPLEGQKLLEATREVFPGA